MRRSQHQSQSLPPQQPTAGHHYSPGLESTLSDSYLTVLSLECNIWVKCFLKLYFFLMHHFIKTSELASVIAVAKKIRLTEDFGQILNYKKM